MTAVGVHTRTGDPLDQTRIDPPDDFAGYGFGASIDIDGDLMAVGATRAEVNGVNAGAVYLYQRDPQTYTGWTHIHTLHRDPPQDYGNFGYAIALQGDTLVVGGPFDPRDGGFWQGIANIYERDLGGPDNWGLAMSLEDETDGDQRRFGQSVALDGDLVAVGAPGADGGFNGHGKTFLYSRAAGWTRVKEIVNPDGQPRDWYGSAVALEGDTLVVGAQYADADGANVDTGAAFVYRRDEGGAGQWGQVSSLLADTPRHDSLFGGTLALEGDAIVVGALNEKRYENGQIVATQVGAAYVYGRDHGGSEWGLVAALRRADGASLDRFGSSLALAGDDLWVGAPNVDAGGFGYEGMIYHYNRDEGGVDAWGSRSEVAADDGSRSAFFGGSLAADEIFVVAGAPEQDTLGAVYVLAEGNLPDAVFLPVVFNNWTMPTGTLEDGGSLRSPEGAIIGAVSGTIDGPLDATIMALQVPSTSLPPGFARTGDYYYLSAARQVIAPADKPFLLGLPVPPGVATDELAMAVLTPPKTVLDGPDDAPLWTLSAGHYDADSNLFVITITTLDPEALTVVLVTDPGFEPIPTTANPSTRTGQGVPSFSVSCHTSGYSCTPENKAWLVTELENAYTDIVTTRQFPEPALVDMYGIFDDIVNWVPLIELSPSYSDIWIRDHPCEDGESGHYHPVTRSMLICLDPNAAPGTLERQAVRHEFFHAVQHAYPRLHEDGQTSWDNTRWIIEGTATAVENSSTLLMTRDTGRDLFLVTTPITSTLHHNEYDAQDFWVYTGLESNQTIAYLQSIFVEGGTPEHVDLAIPLADAYWSWAKNQAIEHHETMGDAFGFGPCDIENDVIDPAKMNVLNADTQYFVEGVLPPLTSALVEIEVPTGRDRLVVYASNDTDEMDLRYKVYDQGEAACENIPDGLRFLENIPAGGLRYMLLSNVGLSQEFTYRVEVD